jgi:hypothetical protein
LAVGENSYVDTQPHLRRTGACAAKHVGKAISHCGMDESCDFKGTMPEMRLLCHNFNQTGLVLSGNADL